MSRDKLEKNVVFLQYHSRKSKCRCALGEYDGNTY
jgi:hypothetical protein